MGISIDIKKRLGNFKLDVSFISDAKRIGILGASGCGKSLTLKSIAGVERPDSGRIEVGGRLFFDRDSKIDMKPQRRNIGYMFQNYALFPTMTVYQNIASGLRRQYNTGLIGLTGKRKSIKSEKDERIFEILERFRLGGLEEHLPGELSGGQQQRVALARIMIYRPDLIMLDEPFSALDQYLRDRLQYEMMEMLSDYKGQVIMVSHNRDEIYRFSEELIIMDRGSIIIKGATDRIFSDPKKVEIARVTGCKNFSSARRINNHKVEALDWGVILCLNREIPEDIRYLGYRAHFFEPIWGEKKGNCIKCNIAGIDNLPFERKYYIKPENNERDTELICWFLQESGQKDIDEKGLPDYLRMNEEQVLLLK